MKGLALIITSLGVAAGAICRDRCADAMSSNQCNDKDLVKQLCEKDPWCCNNKWDDQCKHELFEISTDNCAGKYRVPAQFMNAEEKKEFVAAVLKMKVTPSIWADDPTVSARFRGLSWWDTLLAIHLYHQQSFNQFAHGGPAFPLWHRQFLHVVEMGLEAVSGKKIRYPVWDWSSQGTAALFSDDLLGGNGHPSRFGPTLQAYPGAIDFPFKGLDCVTTGAFSDVEAWNCTGTMDFSGLYGLGQPKCLIRSLGSSIRNPPLWSTAQQGVSSFQYDGFPFANGYSDSNQPNSGSFRPFLESQLHNTGHQYIGGSMGLLSSPFDPAFFAHHAMVDRLTECWLKTTGSLNPQYPAKLMQVSPPSTVRAKYFYENSYRIGIRVEGQTASQFLSNLYQGHLEAPPSSPCGYTITFSQPESELKATPKGPMHTVDSKDRFLQRYSWSCFKEGENTILFNPSTVYYQLPVNIIHIDGMALSKAVFVYPVSALPANMDTYDTSRAYLPDLAKEIIDSKLIIRWDGGSSYPVVPASSDEIPPQFDESRLNPVIKELFEEERADDLAFTEAAVIDIETGPASSFDGALNVFGDAIVSVVTFDRDISAELCRPTVAKDVEAQLIDLRTNVGSTEEALVICDSVKDCQYIVYIPDTMEAMLFGNDRHVGAEEEVTSFVRRRAGTKREDGDNDPYYSWETCAYRNNNRMAPMTVFFPPSIVGLSNGDDITDHLYVSAHVGQNEDDYMIPFDQLNMKVTPGDLFRPYDDDENPYETSCPQAHY